MKTAVVLLNMGGPDSPQAVKPFLLNMFGDKAILPFPQPLRGIMAWYIATMRLDAARDIYAKIGGKSPIAELSRQQAEALEKALSLKGEYRVFTAMRYWKPEIASAVEEVKAYGPGKVILLPLYPQYSTTSTQSAFDEWYRQAKAQDLTTQHHPICCYPFDEYFVDAHLKLIRPVYEEAEKHGKPRILFSAHGLPKRVIDKGDPYAWQIDRSVSAIMRKFGEADHLVCYQSRVGKIEWIKPWTDEEITRAGKENVPVVVVPIAFVSEHSETLVELDIEYRALANKSGVPFYGRVPALGTSDEFIESLSWLVEATKFYPNCSNSLGRQCPEKFGKCGFREWQA